MDQPYAAYASTDAELARLQRIEVAALAVLGLGQAQYNYFGDIEQWIGDLVDADTMRALREAVYGAEVVAHSGATLDSGGVAAACARDPMPGASSGANALDGLAAAPDGAGDE